MRVRRLREVVSVVGCLAVSRNHLKKSRGHGVHKCSEDAGLKSCPGCPDGVLQLLAGSILCVIGVYAAYKNPPDVFHWIEIGATRRPDQNLDLLRAQPRLRALTPMNGGIVLLEGDVQPSEFTQEGHQVFALVFRGVNFRRGESEFRFTKSAEAPPTHD